MSLAHKTALMVLMFTIANVAIGFGIHTALVAPEFEALERNEAAKDIGRVDRALQREISHLEDLVRDWAYWDDSYAFVESRDLSYSELKLSSAGLLASGLDGVLIFDSNAQIIASAVFDSIDRTEITIPELSQEVFEPSHPLLSSEDPFATVSGIMPTSRGPLLVASNAIYDSQGVGPARGHMVVLSFLDAEFIAGLSRRTGIHLDIWAHDSPAVSSSVRTALADPVGRTFFALDEDETRMNAFLQITDLRGEPALVVKAGLPREIAKRSEAVSQLTFLFLLVQGAGLAFMMMILLRRSILQPLKALSAHLLEIRRTNDLSVRVGTHHGDEVGELSRDFDRMLSRLEEQVRERQRSEKALRRSEERLREAQATARVGGWEYDVASDSVWWSEELFRMYDLDPDGPTPAISELLDFIHPDDRSSLRADRDASRLAGEKRIESEQRVITASGALRRHHIIWNTEYDDAGVTQRIFGTVTDVTERHDAESGVRRAATVFDTATEAIVITDSEGRILDVNAAFSAITGFSSGEAVGQTHQLLDSGRHDWAFFGPIIDTVRSCGQWEGEIWIRHKQGKAIPAWVSIGRTLEDESEQLVYVFNDMTARKKSEELILRQANMDMLTGIPNRSLFADRLARETTIAAREETVLALLFIDLDDFKDINDTLGHAAGDEVLKQTAIRIRDCIREVDTVARLGGDEFAVIAPALADPVDAEWVAERILEALAVPHLIHEQKVVISASIGITLFPRDAADDRALLRNADFAMYRAKEAGRNTSRFFTAEMNQSALRRAKVESHLEHALEHGEFHLNYQPIVALPEGRLVGVEALLRWRNDALGEVLPSEFIPIAERKGYILAIDAWVLRTACRQVKAWQQAGHPELRLAANLSPYGLGHGDVVASTSRALFESGLEPEYLELEVTESMLVKDVERTSDIFRSLREKGIRLSIDDFGTGYSSLSYLRNFPFDVLKIDRTFVHDAGNHPGGVSLLRAIVAMGESLGLDVIVEGIETADQHELACRLGCGFSQGYYFSKPLSPEQFEQLVEYSSSLPKPIGSDTFE